MELSPPYRLALAYAPRRARPATLALLTLDHRLGEIVRATREPMLAQLKLAWWRDRLAEPPSAWPQGEPLLKLLAGWAAEAGALGGLVDGWEALLLEGDPATLIEGRALAGAALARVLNQPTAAYAASMAARHWSINEFGVALADTQEPPILPRDLRGLAVLVKLAGKSGQSRWTQFLAAIRTGLFGR